VSRRRKSPFRAIAIAAGAIVVLAVVVVAIAVLLVDPNNLKPRIIAEVRRATGRDITIEGPVSLEPTLPPTLSAEDVSIANMPGGSRPRMATVRRVEAQIDLLALLTRHVVIERLVLLQPDLLLETDLRGVPNWRLERPAASPAPSTVASPGSSPPAASAPPGAPFVELQRLSVQTIHIRDGVLTWRDPRRQRTVRLELQKLDGTATSIEAPVSLSGEGRLGGAAFSLTAQTGPLTRLLDRVSATPWPLQATILSGTGVDGAILPGITSRLVLSGSLTEPMQARGYTLVVDGTIPDLAALAPVGTTLPHLKGVTLSGRIADTGAVFPDVSQLKLHAGPSDLSELMPGLLLDQTDIAIPGADAPMHGETHGTLAGTPLDVVATLGAPRFLLGAATTPRPATPPARTPAGPFPVDLAVDVAGLKLTAQGGVASPATLSGLNIAVRADLPDLRTLTPLVGRRLPLVRDIAFKGTIADGPGGYSHAIVLTDASLTAPPGDLAGDATLLFEDRLRLQANIASKLIDMDALMALARSGDVPASPTAGTALTSEPAAPAPPSSSFMDRALPLAALNLGDADVSLTLGEIRTQGVSYHDVTGHAMLVNGKLTLDPFAGLTPSGRLEATLSVDAGQAEPPVAVTLRAPGLSARPVLGLLGLPDDVNGSVEINADLKGTGQTPRALLAGVDGRLGVAMVDGDVDNRAIAAAVGEVLRAAKLPADLGGAGRTRLRCLAIRLDATHGTATIGALVLDTSRLLLQGSGSVMLGDDALSLRLRPVLRLGAGPGLAVPVRVEGTIRDPKFTVDVGGALEATLSTAAGLQGGRGVSPSGADRNGDLCPPALAAARNGAAGPMPGTPPGAQAPSAPGGKINPGALLRGLVR
jgi:AsmA protein